MQISGYSISPSIPMGKTSLSPATQEATDSAVINFPGNSFSGLVKEASAMPEVRSDLVDSFKARIQSGQYPNQNDIAGLADAIGGSIVQQAASESSAQ
jgi:Anti-sigma-28 factor, FlgM